MKKQLKKIIFSLLLCFALVPAVKSEAASQLVERTFVNNKSSIEFGSTSINKFGEGNGVYAGGYVTNLTQTGATLTSVTLTWTAASGATSYYITDKDSKILDYVSGTSVTLTLPESTYQYAVGVFPCDANNNIGYNYLGALYVATTPKKVSGLKINGSFAGTGGLSKLNVIWNDSACYGFEASCYNRKGKQIQTVETTLYRSASFSKTNAQNIYTVKVRPYVYINGNQKLYGDYSNVLYAVPQPTSLSKNKDVKRNSINLKWKKVSGATKYEIYMSTKKSSGYKKVATVKGNKSSCVVTKFRGKTLDTTSKKYIKIVTYAKFGKKTVKSKSNPQITAKTTIYWR